MPCNPTFVVSAAVIERDGAFLLTRRLAGTHLEGLWEFPGGKCEPDEAPEDGLVREIREELGATVVVGPCVLVTEHAYADRIVELHFFECTLNGEPAPLLGQEMRWVPRDQLRHVEWPPADRALIDRLTGSD